MNWIKRHYAEVLALPIACAVVFAPKVSLPFFCLWAFIYFVQSPFDRVMGIFRNSLALPIILFFSWSFLSLVWSLEPLYGLKSTLGGFALALTALGMGTYLPTLSEKQRALILKLFSYTFCISLVLCGTEFLSQGAALKFISNLKSNGTPSYGLETAYKSTAFVLAGLVLIITGYCYSQKRFSWAFTLFIITAVLCLLSHSTTAFLGCVLGASAFLLTLAFPTLITWIVMLSVITLHVVLPLCFFLLPLSSYGLELYNRFGSVIASFYHRMVIWEFSMIKWMEHPWLGWGAASSRSMPGSEEEIFIGGRVLSLHSHNYLIQSGLELGIVGAVLYTLVLVSILWLIHTRLKSSVAKATALGLFVTIYTFSNSEHSLWHHWWIAWICIFASLCVVVTRQIEATRS